MFAACRGRFLHLWSESTRWNFDILIKRQIKKDKKRLRQFCSYIISTVLMQAPWGGGGWGGWSHLWLFLDLEELGHVRKVFLVGFSHLLLCSLWVHDLQSLQITWLLTVIIIGDIKKELFFFFTCRGVKATLELVPEERSLTVDFPPYVMLCFCSVRWCVKTGQRQSHVTEILTMTSGGGGGGDLPVVISRSWPWWHHWPGPAWHAHCRSSPAGPDWSPDPPGRHHLRSASEKSISLYWSSKIEQSNSYI